MGRLFLLSVFSTSSQPRAKHVYFGYEKVLNDAWLNDMCYLGDSRIMSGNALQRAVAMIQVFFMIVFLGYLFVIALGLSGCGNTTSSYGDRYYELVGFVDDSIAVLYSNRSWTEVTSTLSGDLDRTEHLRGAIVLLKYRGSPSVVWMDSIDAGYGNVQRSGADEVVAFLVDKGGAHRWKLSTGERGRFAPVLNSDGCSADLQQMRFRPGPLDQTWLLAKNLKWSSGYLDCAIGSLEDNGTTATFKLLPDEYAFMRGRDDALYRNGAWWMYELKSSGREIHVYKGADTVARWMSDSTYVGSEGDTLSAEYSVYSYWADGCLELVGKTELGYPSNHKMMCLDFAKAQLDTTGLKPAWNDKEFIYGNGDVVDYSGILP